MRGSKKQAVRGRFNRACQAVVERLEERTLLSTIYVDASVATGAHDGSSWTDAYQDLQQLGCVPTLSHCLRTDPHFYRNASPGADGTWGTADDDYGNLRIRPGSAAIDTGSNAAIPNNLTTDLAGNPRIAGAAVDIGAYEYAGLLSLPDATEGSPMSLALSPGDLDPATISSWTILWGDGKSDTVLGSPASINHTYVDSGSYVIETSATVAGRSFPTAWLQVAVADVAPTIALSGNPTTREPQPYTLTLGAVTDPGTDTVTQWIVNWGDGSTSTYTSGGDKDHFYIGGPYTASISVTLVDEDGSHAAAGTRSVLVQHTPPVITLSGDPTIIIGQPYTLNLSASGPADNPILSWTIDWGDGDIEPYLGNPSSATHTYTTPGHYDISASVTDADGTSSMLYNAIAVGQMPPTTIDGSVFHAPNGATYSVKYNDSMGQPSVFWELWKSDAANPNGILLYRFDGDKALYYPPFTAPAPGSFTAVGDKVFFVAYSGAVGTELWVTDGTPSGTHLVADLSPGTHEYRRMGILVGYAANDSNPQYLTAFNGDIYFTIDSTGYGLGVYKDIWKSDGQQSGTQVVYSASAQNQTIYSINSIDGMLVFSTGDSSGILRFYRMAADGAVTALLPGPSTLRTSYSLDATVFDDRLYFNAFGGTQPWAVTGGPVHVSAYVPPPNQPPVLTPIDDKRIDEGSQLGFIAAATDPDVPTNTLTYSLDPGAPAGASIDPATGLFTWTPTEAQGPGTYSITVRATDDGSPALSDTKSFSITVNEANQAPVLAAIQDKTINEGEPLSFTATATDDDLPANGLTYSLAAGAPAGAAIDPFTGLFTWTPSEAQGPGTYNITIRVTDDGSPSLSDSETFTITVNEVNQAPVLDAIGDKTVNEGELLSFSATARDDDVPANTLTYNLAAGAPAGASIDPATGLFTWTPAEAQGPGTYNITVRVADDGSPALSDTKSFSITVDEANQAPVLAAISDKSVNELTSLSFTASASDADLPANTILYSLDPGAPAGASIDPATGLFTWTPSEAQGPGTYNITIRVTDDGSPSLSDSETFTVTVGEVNQAPVLNAIGDRTINECELLSFSATATDADLPSNLLTYSLDPGAPAGASIDASTGLFTWTPTEAQGPGSYQITIRVTDNGSPALSDSQTLAISVAEVNRPPVLAPMMPYSITEGSTLRTYITASDPDLPSNTLTFSLEDDPGGATIDPVTGLFTFTAEDGDRYLPRKATIRVTDDGGLSDTVTFEILVNDIPPSAAVSGPAVAVTGTDYTLSLSATTLPWDAVHFWTIDWGDGAFDELTGNPSAATHRYTVPAARTIKAIATDWEGMSSPVQMTAVQVVAPTTLRGIVFNDLNANGRKDIGEPALIDWPLFLDADADGVRDVGEQAARTDSSGQYSINGVLPGSYSLICQRLPGWRSSSPSGMSYDLSVQGGQAVATKDFAQTQKALVSGSLFLDADADGKREAGETALGGYTLFIDADRDGQLDSRELRTSTDAFGNWSFRGLSAGAYPARVALPSSFRQTTLFLNLSPAAGSINGPYNVGIVRTGSISGSIFNDLSAEGTRNTGELGLPSRQVFLDANKNGKLDAGEKSLPTDSAGRYTFTNLIPGSYRITAVLPAGWRTSSPAIGYYDIALLGGQVLTAKDFGQTQKTLITGSVWSDANSNGIRNPADNGLYNYRVYIDLDQNGVWDSKEPSALTDKPGNFSFSTVSAGTYTIRVAAPKGYRVTYPKVGYYSSALEAGQAIVLSFGVGR